MDDVYLILGASSDIGRCLISDIMQKKPDARIVAHGFNDDERIKPVLKKYGESISYLDADLSSSSGANKIIEFLKSNDISPSCFVFLPALPVVNRRFVDFDLQRFQTDLSLQLISIVNLLKHIIPSMKKNHFGRIVFMETSYILGAPPKNVSEYIVVKSAIQALMKSIAVEYASYGITANAIAASMIETHFLKDTSHLIVEMAANSNPMKRNAQVEDITPAILFLLSEESRFITGVTLPITGGSVII